MKSRNYKAFIVEGEAREPLIIDNLCRIHFKNDNFKIITLPAGQNIYMLWQKMKKDEFETDIIELLRESSQELEAILSDLTREDFSEIYLFFDYDGHQKNMSSENTGIDVINEMFLNFDNETENGKLYINYPMVEALRDFEPGICGEPDRCYCLQSQMGSYKNISANRLDLLDFRKYTFEVWREILNVFVLRISCLTEKEGILSHDQYKELVDPHKVYDCQKNHIEKGAIFILSAFPEFLLDYFSVRFWNACIKCSAKSLKNCGQKPGMMNSARG